MTDRIARWVPKNYRKMSYEISLGDSSVFLRYHGKSVARLYYMDYDRSFLLGVLESSYLDYIMRRRTDVD